ncbi:hypothetical protein [Zunongwangia sp. HRR-M8]|uniref:hypothetical protein n=1 Tax=Zunongwangia sp. HRR-M8 TaxID=3015170 RepID=UPI0022DE6395|nr:hypothetical protein [Zunongwangia sp. HRR-M8]WBL22805.1 hypothetical protein PBT89_02315 [Zunongwangia sp. HRR-M8]
MTLRKILSVSVIASTLFISCKDNSNKDSSEQPEKDKQEVIESEKKQETKIDSATLTNKLESNNEQLQYICYTSDNDKNKRIWIELGEDGKANKVKYEGQKETIDLKYTKEEYSEGGAHPTITKYYDEIYKGEVNGTYTLIHSGVWDYVTYTRGRDGKEFNYTIDHEKDPYGNKPCF